MGQGALERFGGGLVGHRTAVLARPPPEVKPKPAHHTQSAYSGERRTRHVAVLAKWVDSFESGHCRESKKDTCIYGVICSCFVLDQPSYPS
jgi:hypothetical protein